jgi:hypothetical protein
MSLPKTKVAEEFKVLLQNRHNKVKQKKKYAILIENLLFNRAVLTVMQKVQPGHLLHLAFSFVKNAQAHTVI